MGNSEIDYAERTMRAYNLLADELASSFDDFFERYAHKEAARFLLGLGRDGRILDLGCGGGPASLYFCRQGYRTISADLSAGMLAQCRMHGLRNLVRLDLEALAFERHAFAGVWAHTCLLHVPKARLAGVLQALGETIEPGGRLFIALREGQGEGYRGQPRSERWFSHFDGHELEVCVPDGFHVTRRARTELESVTFLSYHLAKDGGGG
jgi:2-polyprenyl-3-methyl-5-hydroxy-6-metoxy-1,4-benzoquinol methylase